MKMKRTVLYIAALVAFPAVSSAQLYVEPEQNVDCSVFIEKNVARTRSRAWKSGTDMCLPWKTAGT